MYFYEFIMKNRSVLLELAEKGKSPMNSKKKETVVEFLSDEHYKVLKEDYQILFNYIKRIGCWSSVSKTDPKPIMTREFKDINKNTQKFLNLSFSEQLNVLYKNQHRDDNGNLKNWNELSLIKKDDIFQHYFGRKPKSEELIEKTIINIDLEEAKGSENEILSSSKNSLLIL